MTEGYERFWSRFWGDARNADVGYGGLSAGERDRVDAVVGLVPDDAAEVLEVGCGSGLIANRLLERGLAVTGLDISEEALARVRGERLRGSVEAIPAADASFDAVVAADLLEHLPAGAFERALAELARVARHYLVVNSPDREQLDLARTRCTRCTTAFHASRHVRAVAAEELPAWFPDFELVAVVGCGAPRRRRLAALQRAAQALGDTWYRTGHAVCPNCGYPVEPPRPSQLVRALNGGVQWVAGRLLPSRPAEFAALLRRRPASGTTARG